MVSPPWHQTDLPALLYRLVEAEIVTGTCKGDDVLLPRITFYCDELDTPFALRRRQFPIRPSFAMTNNMSQGQIMKRAGLYLPQPVFSHGQLYVALSRVGSRSQLSVCVEHGKFVGREGVYTKNLVFKTIFH